MIDLKEFIQYPLLAIDFETANTGDEGESAIGTHGDNKKIEIFSVAAKKGNKIIGGAYPEDQWDSFWRRIKTKTIVFHNAKFDLAVIKARGIDIHLIKFEDTLIMAHLLDESRTKKLKELRRLVLGKPARTAWVDVNKENRKEYFEYAKLDAIDTLELYYDFRSQITAEDLEVVYELEKQVVFPTLEMEYYGIKLDLDLLVKQDIMLTNFMDDIQSRIDGALGQKLLGELIPTKTIKKQTEKKSLNISSHKQMQHLFYGKLGYPRREEWRTKTGFSINAVVLDIISKDRHKEHKVARKLAEMIVRWRLYEKTQNSFTKPFLQKKDGKGYIFGSFNSSGTKTGRFSASRPNLEQIKRDPFIEGDMDTNLRSLFICEEDEYLIGADYSQIELRVMAELSKDPIMCKAFLDGMDIHQTTADAIHCSRDEAKTINFGTSYGMGSQGFSNQTGISIRKARGFIEAYWRKYSRLFQFFNDIKKSAAQVGYVRSISGRKRRFYERFDGSAARQATNHPVQGCLSGDSRIMVKNKGYIKIKELVNKNILIWDGDKYSRAKIVPSGFKQKVEITFKGNKKFICSPDHKFLTVDNVGIEKWRSVLEFPKKSVIRVRFSEPESRGFSSSFFKKELKTTHWKAPNGVANTLDYSLEDIRDDFQRGVFVGRVVSDGSIIKGRVYLLVAEHEKKVGDILEKIIPYNYHKEINKREGKKKIVRYAISSVLLSRQLLNYGFKYKIPDECFKNKEMLRGFLCGMFDGDGCVLEGNCISLTFGKKHFYEEYAKDIQRGLEVFGIRSRVTFCSDRITVNILKRDSLKFKKEIGFLNIKKLNKITNKIGVRLDGIMGKTLIVKSIKIYNEKIEMFDVVNTKSGKFMCEGLIVHNSTADLVKLAMVLIYRNIDHSKARFILQVHDELVFVCKRDYAEECKEIIQYCCEHVIKTTVSLIAEPKIGLKWSMLK